MAKRIFGFVLLIMSTLSAAAGLTVDWPTAWEKWTSFIEATGKALRPSVPAILFYLIAAALLFLGARLLSRRSATVRLSQGSDHSALRIAELLSPDGVLRNLDFRDVFLVGPAILVHNADTPFVHCTFDGYDLPPAWEIPGWIEPGKETLGAVKVERCTFTRCKFEGVAWAMEAEQLEGLLQAVEEFNKPPEEEVGGSTTPPSPPPASRASE